MTQSKKKGTERIGRELSLERRKYNTLIKEQKKYRTLTSKHITSLLGYGSQEL